MHKIVAMVGAGMLSIAAGQAVAQISPADKTFATKAAEDVSKPMKTVFESSGSATSDRWVWPCLPGVMVN